MNHLVRYPILLTLLLTLFLGACGMHTASAGENSPEENAGEAAPGFRQKWKSPCGYA